MTNEKSLKIALLKLRSQYQSHPYHLCNASPWPILTSGAVLAMLSSAALWFNNLDYTGWSLSLGIITTTMAMAAWWGDCITEGTHMGTHTKAVQHCLTLGVTLFIVTEACFFLSVFWAYFHSSLAPTVELGFDWLESDYYKVLLMSNIILKLSSSPGLVTQILFLVHLLMR